MKWTVEYKSVEAVTVEADTEDEAISLAQNMDQSNFWIAENQWDAYEEDE